MKPADLGRPLRVFFTGSSFAFFWTGGALLSLFVLPLEELRKAPAAVKIRRSRRWVQRGFRLFHGYMRLWGLTDYDPREVRLELPEGPCVLIVNHPTLVDVTALMSVIGDLSVVVKDDYWRWFVARLLRQSDHINGGDGGALASGAVAVQALERLAKGQSVLIFPEGTRSPERGLHPFQRGAFEIARRAGVPLVPLLITADPPWLMKHQRWYEVPARMNKMRLRHLPGAPVEVPRSRSKELAVQYERLYREALEDWFERRERPALSRDMTGRPAENRSNG